MRILLDITHPAHLHFFRHVVPELQRRGHELKLTGRDKDILRELAEQYGFEIECFGGSPPGVVGMGRTLIGRKLRLAKIVRGFRPQVLAALGGTFIGALGWSLRVPNVVFYDTENATLSNRITYPFARRVCTPAAYLDDVPRQVRYPGYHELAYLSRRRFKPDASIRQALGVGEQDRYAIVRFVGWQASHDLNLQGLSGQAKRQFVSELAQAGKVFISSEGPLPDELASMRFPLPVSRMHDAMAFASLVAGESSTMASEAAVLGVPSVFIHPPIRRGYTKEQADRWGIVHWITPDRLDEATQTAVRLLSQPEPEHWQSVAMSIEEASVDVVEFVCDQIEQVGWEGR